MIALNRQSYRMLKHQAFHNLIFPIELYNFSFQVAKLSQSIDTGTKFGGVSDNLPSSLKQVDELLLKSIDNRDDRVVATTIKVKSERLSKYIANTGICSRREAETRIKMGRVILDGAICTAVHTTISKDQPHSVIVDGIKIGANTASNVSSLSKGKLWAVIKKRGELVADKDDSKNRPLLLDRVKEVVKLSSDESLKPVSRLDFNTEGLCLLTNNGLLARLLDGDDAGFKRYYRVRVHGLITEQKLGGFKTGVFVKNKRQPVMDVEVERVVGTNSWLKLSTSSRSNRSIIETMKQLKLSVTRLICVGFGPYKLSAIPLESGIIELKLPKVVELSFYKQVNKQK